MLEPVSIIALLNEYQVATAEAMLTGLTHDLRGYMPNWGNIDRDTRAYWRVRARHAIEAIVEDTVHG